MQHTAQGEVEERALDVLMGAHRHIHRGGRATRVDDGRGGGADKEAGRERGDGQYGGGWVDGGKEGDVWEGREGTERKKGRGRWDRVGKMEAKEGSGEAKGKERGTGHGEGGKGKERNMKNIKYTPPTWGGLPPLLGKEDGGRGLSVEFAVYQEAGRGAEEGGEGDRKSVV